MCGMPNRLVLEQTRTVPVSVEDAFRGTLMHLAPACHRRYGLIPPVSRVTDNVGDWGTVGSTRTLVLSGIGSLREEVVRVDAPNSLGVSMSHITGLLSALVAQIQSDLLFIPVGTGTRITWRYALHARPALATPALTVIGWSWRGYARQALEELSELLVA
jgi:hypothetical protein